MGSSLPEQNTRQGQQACWLAVAFINILGQGFFRPCQVAQQHQAPAFFKQQITSLGQNPVHKKPQILFAEHAGDFSYNPSIHKGFHRRNLLHFQAGRQFGLVVHVDTRQPEASICFVRQLGKVARLHAAGNTPGRPKVEHHGHFG